MVRYPRLLWQLFPTYLLITLIGLIAVGVFAARTHEKFYVGLIREELERRAEFVAAETGESLAGEDLAKLRATAERTGRTMKTRITVIRPDGSVAYDTDEKAENMQPHGDRPEVATALAGSVGFQTHYSDTVKRRMTYVAVPIVRREQVVGVVRTALPVETVNDVIGRAKYELIGWGVLIAGVCALVSWLVSRWIARPLERMRQGAEEFAGGNLAYKLPIPPSAEMAGLAHSLNDMAGQMQGRIDTIVEQTSRQDAILESMVEGVLAVDAQQKIISLNPAAAALLGCSRQGTLGRDAQYAITQGALRQVLAEAMTSGEPIEQDLDFDAGSPRIIHVRATSLVSPERRRRGAVVVLHDITNIRRLENLRREFVANVSHELKTPITSIKGFIETLLDGALDSREDAERFLGIAARQTERLGAIVDDLLSLAKIEQNEGAASLELQPGGVRSVLEAAVHNCAPLAKERQVRVRLEMTGEVSATLNPPLLEQAVGNLLDNAIQYSGPDKEVVVTAAAGDREVRISVRDEGCGIEAEHIPRLFERFYRVDKARSRKLGGTGLGLAIVKHIVSAHRGRVDVTSTPGQGSTFTIVLPRAGSPRADAAGSLTKS